MACATCPRRSAEAGLDFAAMARGAGYEHAQRIDTHADWVAALPQLLARTGTSFVELGVRPDAPLISAQRAAADPARAAIRAHAHAACAS